MISIGDHNSLDHVLTTASSGMSADSVRLNLISSNLANASSASGDETQTYRAKTAQLSEVKNHLIGLSEAEQPVGGVRVTDITTSEKPLEKKYEPDNPQANSEGYVYISDVNPIEEMTNMIEASRSYQANADIMNTTKSLILQSINVLNER
jgi:flagellar basal-body rod protein FlgC